VGLVPRTLRLFIPKRGLRSTVFGTITPIESIRLFLSDGFRKVLANG
jgi:hypothetical protein